MLERRTAEQHRVDLLSALTLHETGPAGTLLAEVPAHVALPLLLIGPPPRPLLPPNKTYRVSVTWEWQSWRPSGNESKPPPPVDGAWQAGGTDTLRFATAAAAPLAPPPPPVDLIGEQSFDPRSVARYVTGGQPSGELPHLLDDPIRVTFSVDYLPALLAAYGYETRVEVRPTDVAPGTQQTTPHPPDVVSGIKLVSWVADGVLRPVEQLVAVAVAALPCVSHANLGGLAAEVRAALEPETAYDLMLVAHPTGGSADRVIQRLHFRTSRYRDVDELLRRLGLPAGAPTAVAPDDVLLPGAWPALGAAVHDDAAFDAALSALGLDPWPIAAAPRTTTLWAQPAPGESAWRLAGVLLEAPEPIARRGRIVVSGAVGTTPLVHLRSTTSGTRVLLAPAAPLVPAPTDALLVRLTDDLRDRTAEGAALLLGGPRTIRRELV